MSSEISPGWHWPDWALLSTVATLAAVLRLHALDRKSFWIDEGTSFAVSHLDWYNFARLMWRREGNMSLYYLLLRGWQHFGNGEFYFRALSVIFAVATIPAVYWLGYRLFNRRVAVAASFLMAVNAYNIRYAQEARSYTLYVLLATLSCASFVVLVESPSPRRRRAYILFSSLAVYSHFYFGFLIVAQWLAVRLRPGDYRSSVAPAFRWIALIASPALLFAATTGVGPLRWVESPKLVTLYAYYEHLAGNGGPFLLALFLLAIAGLVAKHGARLWRSGADPSIWRCQFLLIVTFFPILLVFMLSHVWPFFVPRYFIACQPAFLILAAAGMDRFARWWSWSAALVLLVALSIRGTLNYYERDFDLNRDDYRGASRYLLDRSRKGDAVLFDTAMARMPYEFYKSIYRGHGHPPDVIYPSHGDVLDYRDFFGNPSSDVIRSAMLGRERIWVVVKTYGESAQVDPTAQQISNILSDAFPCVEERTFSGVIVLTYSR